MKIKTLVEQTIELNVEFPLFFREGVSSFTKVIDERTYVNVFNGGSFSTVNINSRDDKWVAHYQNSTPITEAEFNKAFLTTLSAIADVNITHLTKAAA